MSPGEEMNKVLPMHQKFTPATLYGAKDMFVSAAAAATAESQLFD